MTQYRLGRMQRKILLGKHEKKAKARRGEACLSVSGFAMGGDHETNHTALPPRL